MRITAETALPVHFIEHQVVQIILFRVTNRREDIHVQGMAHYGRPGVFLPCYQGVFSGAISAGGAKCVLRKICLESVSHPHDVRKMDVLGLRPRHEPVVGFNALARVMDMAIARVPFTLRHVDPPLERDLLVYRSAAADFQFAHDWDVFRTFTNDEAVLSFRHGHGKTAVHKKNFLLSDIARPVVRLLVGPNLAWPIHIPALVEEKGLGRND